MLQTFVLLNGLFEVEPQENYKKNTKRKQRMESAKKQEPLEKLKTNQMHTS